MKIDRVYLLLSTHSFLYLCLLDLTCVCVCVFSYTTTSGTTAENFQIAHSGLKRQSKLQINADQKLVSYIVTKN